jgi:hypothetical protein
MTRYTTEQLASFPWIVSTDTLRTEDLLVRYWQTAEQLGADLCTVLPALQHLVGEDSKEADWDDDMACGCLLQLGDILQDLAPSGFYFGASEGDGACFGFWLDNSWREVLEHCGCAFDSDPEAVTVTVQELLAAGVDPDTYEDLYQGEAEGYNETEAGADYAAQLAEDAGMIQATAQWPHTCIDWEEAWRELELGDGYWLQRINGAQWAVFRSA